MQTAVNTMRLLMYLLSKHQRMRRIRKKFHKNRKDPLMNRLKDEKKVKENPNRNIKHIRHN